MLCSSVRTSGFLLPLALSVVLSLLLLYYYDKNLMKPQSYQMKFSDCVSARTNSSIGRNYLNYRLHREAFVKTIADCVTESTCHIYYNHVGKTGGTGVEFLFEGLAGQDRLSGCCGPSIMTTFLNKSHWYCNRKFTSLELSTQTTPLDDYIRVIDTCQRHLSKQPKKHRAVSITTFREPITRLLSDLHQVCNKNIHTRTPVVQEVCKRCDQNKDSNFTARQAHMHEYQMEGILHRLHHLTGTIYTQFVRPVAIDMVDLNSFFTDLQLSLPVHYKPTFQKYHERPHNPAKVDTCKFFATNEMIKALGTSFETYRALTLGE